MLLGGISIFGLLLIFIVLVVGLLIVFTVSASGKRRGIGTALLSGLMVLSVRLRPT